MKRRAHAVRVIPYAPDMTSRSDFSDEEWARLGRAPLLAGLAVSLSDPGGPIELVKESRAALKTVLEATREGSFGHVRSVGGR